MDSVRRGLSERSAGIAYQVRFLLPIILAVPLMALQVIVSSILPRPHTTDTDATMLSSTSTIRIKSRKRKWIFPNGYANDGWVLDRKAGSMPLKGGQSKRSAGVCIPAFIIIYFANRYDRN